MFNDNCWLHNMFNQYFWLHFDINIINMKFIDNFVCGIDNIFVKFFRETLLSTIQNIEVE